MTPAERKGALETARLRLRPVGWDDLDALHALWTDPDVRRFLWDDQIIAVERVAQEIEESLDAFRVRRFGMWGARLAESPDLVGFCGLRSFGDPPEVEILYGFAPRLWGRGLATEASRAVLRFAFDELGLGRVYGRTDPPNLPSRRVLERLGMIFLRQARVDGLDLVEYVMPRERFTPP